MNQELVIGSALAGLIALTAAATAVADEKGKEKCYGVAKAGANRLPRGLGSWLLGLRFFLRLRRRDFLPGRRAPGLPRRADEDHVPISTPSG